MLTLEIMRYSLVSPTDKQQGPGPFAYHFNPGPRILSGQRRLRGKYGVLQTFGGGLTFAVWGSIRFGAGVKGDMGSVSLVI